MLYRLAFFLATFILSVSIPDLSTLSLSSHISDYSTWQRPSLSKYTSNTDSEHLLEIRRPFVGSDCFNACLIVCLICLKWRVTTRCQRIIRPVTHDCWSVTNTFAANLKPEAKARAPRSHSSINIHFSNIMSQDSPVNLGNSTSVPPCDKLQIVMLWSHRQSSEQTCSFNGISPTSAMSKLGRGGESVITWLVATTLGVNKFHMTCI